MAQDQTAEKRKPGRPKKVSKRGGFRGYRRPTINPNGLKRRSRLFMVDDDEWRWLKSKLDDRRSGTVSESDEV